MKRTFLFFTTLLCFLFFISCKQAPATVAEAPETTKPDMTVLKAEIQALNDTWAKATNARDVATIMGFYGDDIISMQDDKATITGKAAVEKDAASWFSEAKEGNVAMYETLEVFGDDKMLTEIGISTTKDASGKVVNSGKYIAVWEKRNGKWECIREMTNDDMKREDK